MGILSFAGALLVLFVAAACLCFASQGLEGRKTYFVHSGWVVLVLLVGGGLFPFYGWASTGWVLGVAAAWSLLLPLWARVFGDGPHPGLYHGDDPGESP